MNQERQKTYLSLWSKNVIERLDKELISDGNKKLLRNFQNYLFSTGTKTFRVGKLTKEITKRLLAKENGLLVIGCDLNQATKQDILNAVSYINRSEDWAEATKSDYRRAIKQFYKWFKEEDERVYSKDDHERIIAQKLYHFVENEVKRAYKPKQIDPSTILTEEDVEKAVGGCRTIKEKAFIKFLHETGVRAEEMINLKVKHIEIKKNIGLAHVDGKTGRRTVQFVKSMPYVVQWLSIHPCKEVPEAYLWLGERTNRLYEPLKYLGAMKLVQRCFKRAGLKKRHNLHWFRHSRASLLAPHLPESLLCKYMGWVLGSKQVRTYLHLCPQQLEDAFLKINGLVEDSEKKDLPQKCGCGTVNDTFARYCFQCGNPLNVEIALQDQELVKSETNIAIKEMMEMFKNPETMKKFMEFKRT